MPLQEIYSDTLPRSKGNDLESRRIIPFQEAYHQKGCALFNMVQWTYCSSINERKNGRPNGSLYEKSGDRDHTGMMGQHSNEALPDKCCNPVRDVLQGMEPAEQDTMHAHGNQGIFRDMTSKSTLAADRRTWSRHPTILDGVPTRIEK